MKTLIKNGNIITATDSYVADVLIDGEQIAMICRDLTIAADRVIDASGKYVLPGGIDVHTHLSDVLSGFTIADDFESGTIAAAFGGTTSIVNYISPIAGKSLIQTLEAWHEKASGRATIDYGFHLFVNDLNSERMAEIGDMVSEGVTSFKVFLAYPGSMMVDDRVLFSLLQQANRLNALVMVHAENGWVVDLLSKQALAKGQSGPGFHGKTRPTKAEAEAAHRAIALAEIAESPVYLVHMSCGDALKHVVEARDRGLPVFAETCPQYLFLDRSVYDLPAAEAAKYVFSPPARDPMDQQALWQGLAFNHLQVVASDHAPFSKEQKLVNLHDFTQIPNGGAGIEDRTTLTHSGGVLGGKFSLNRWVDVTSTAAAKIFGMYPRKGAVAVGSDADLVIFDPEKEAVISAATHHMRVDYSLYEGTRVKGAPTIVLSRGKVIVENEKFLGAPANGRFIKRAGFNQILQA